MSDSLISAISGIAGTMIGGLISYLSFRFQHKSHMERIKATNKTEFQAEETAKHFLSHKGFTDRSFDTLKKNLGGFEEDELRKILVRAGAIRTYREDGSEWWRLLSRMDEYIESKKKEA